LIIDVLPSVDEHVQCDIHRMTGLLRLSFAQIGNTGKAAFWRMKSAERQTPDVCLSLAGTADFAFFKAEFSVGFC